MSFTVKIAKLKISLLIELKKRDKKTLGAEAPNKPTKRQ